jgi:chorismate dehydratase
LLRVRPVGSEMEKVMTDDGSETFRNDDVDECYHTKSGAIEEAFKKFAEPCKIKELAKKGKIRILDVCFGFGYNTAAAIDTALEENKDVEIESVGLENDERVFDMIQELNPKVKSFELIKQLNKNNLKITKNNISISILLGDARETIKTVSQSFDAVFFDPFSPKKCPELWTEELFREIYDRMEKGAILATYSYARVVKDNLKNAGFRVEDGPIVGRRSPSTIAIKE